jgi:hypothetical protein
LYPISANRLPVVPKDAKDKARAEVQRAQSKFERTGSQHEEARKARRESFERAREAGLTLREIGEVADLHRSRVAEVLSKK